MTRYIRHNPLKQTLREDLRIARSWKVLFLWIPKLLRRKREFSSAFQVALPSSDFVVKPEDIPQAAAARLTKQIEESTRLGFSPPVFQVCRTLGGETVTTVANCWHSRAEILLRIMHLRLGTINPPKEVIAVSLISRLEDGCRLVTSNQRATFDSSPNVIELRLVGAALEAL